MVCCGCIHVCYVLQKRSGAPERGGGVEELVGMDKDGQEEEGDSDVDFEEEHSRQEALRGETDPFAVHTGELGCVPTYTRAV